MLRVNTELMSETGSKLDFVDQELDALLRLLAGVEAEYSDLDVPSTFLQHVADCRKMSFAYRDNLEDLRKGLKASAARFLDHEDDLVRQIEQYLGRQVDGLLLDKGLMARCSAYGMQSDLNSLGLGGMISPQNLPGVVSLDFPGVCLRRADLPVGISEQDHGI